MNDSMTKQQSTCPVMLWDGDCEFCAKWIERWHRLTGDAVSYRPYQDALEDFPQLSVAACRRAVQLVLPDGTVFSGAHAVLRTLSIAGRYPRLLVLYEGFPLFRWLMDLGYRFVAANRSWLPK
ncbi:thiol-disulfide oxidoreductase DCC family protein [Coraliomargarita parva]|uniref:thiol-disulfide oxidoreductase DCC family protein n=1 Tax=Coraliomargarita parva TaxID=3014050 RepID=UPI0022B5B2BE|nr:DCC1-like thiol-disulfide oxidoreductase family protein [Coraliomargarita parva]